MAGPVQSVTDTFSAAVTNRVLTITGCAAGDLLIGFLFCKSATIPAAPTGWTAGGSNTGGSGGSVRSAIILYKTATAGSNTMTYTTAAAGRAYIVEATGWTYKQSGSVQTTASAQLTELSLGTNKIFAVMSGISSNSTFTPSVSGGTGGSYGAVTTYLSSADANGSVLFAYCTDSNTGGTSLFATAPGTAGNQMTGLFVATLPALETRNLLGVGT